MDLNFFDEAMNAVGIKPTYIGFDEPKEKSLDEVLHTCVKCGHARKDHLKQRGSCKFKEQCLCFRYTGR
jgi:hypothetical protein